MEDGDPDLIKALVSIGDRAASLFLLVASSHLSQPEAAAAAVRSTSRKKEEEEQQRRQQHSKGRVLAAVWEARSHRAYQIEPAVRGWRILHFCGRDQQPDQSTIQQRLWGTGGS